MQNILEMYVEGSKDFSYENYGTDYKDTMDELRTYAKSRSRGDLLMDLRFEWFDKAM